MDIIHSVRPEGSRFASYEEAISFYKEGRYHEKSRGSTEDHEEYKIMEVKNGKLFESGRTIPLKRNAETKNGDFVILSDENGTDKVYVETIYGMEPLTWRDV